MHFSKTFSSRARVQAYDDCRPLELSIRLLQRVVVVLSAREMAYGQLTRERCIQCGSHQQMQPEEHSHHRDHQSQTRLSWVGGLRRDGYYRRETAVPCDFPTFPRLPPHKMHVASFPLSAFLRFHSLRSLSSCSLLLSPSLSSLSHTPRYSHQPPRLVVMSPSPRLPKLCASPCPGTWLILTIRGMGMDAGSRQLLVVAT